MSAPSYPGEAQPSCALGHLEVHLVKRECSCALQSLRGLGQVVFIVQANVTSDLLPSRQDFPGTGHLLWGGGGAYAFPILAWLTF